MGKRDTTQTAPSPVYGGCPNSSKVGYRDRISARWGAQKLARELLARGRLIDDVYTYTCPACSRLHLTRMRQFRGGENEILWPAPDLDAQLWAMPEHYRARVEARLTDEGARDDRIAALPDPRPEPTAKQPYANRPRGLRYKRTPHGRV